MVLKISVNVDAWPVVHERLLCFLFWNVVYTFTYIYKYHNPCKSKTIKIVVPWNLLIVNSYYKWRLFIQKTIEVVAFEGPQGKPSYKIATYNSQIRHRLKDWMTRTFCPPCLSRTGFCLMRLMLVYCHFELMRILGRAYYCHKNAQTHRQKHMMGLYKGFKNGDR